MNTRFFNTEIYTYHKHTSDKATLGWTAVSAASLSMGFKFPVDDEAAPSDGCVMIMSYKLMRLVVMAWIRCLRRRHREREV